MLERAQHVIEMIGNSSMLQFQPLSQGDPRQRQPNITRAKADLGWDENVPLRVGLGKTIGYFRSAAGNGQPAS